MYGNECWGDRATDNASVQLPKIILGIHYICMSYAPYQECFSHVLLCLSNASLMNNACLMHLLSIVLNMRPCASYVYYVSCGSWFKNLVFVLICVLAIMSVDDIFTSPPPIDQPIVSFDDLLMSPTPSDLDRELFGAMTLFVEINENEMMRLDCFENDTAEKLKSDIWHNLGSPPGTYELVFKLEERLMDHRIRDGMTAYYLKMDEGEVGWGDCEGGCLEEIDEEGGEEEEGLFF